MEVLDQLCNVLEWFGPGAPFPFTFSSFAEQLLIREQLVYLLVDIHLALSSFPFLLSSIPHTLSPSRSKSS